MPPWDSRTTGISVELVVAVERLVYHMLDFLVDLRVYPDAAKVTVTVKNDERRKLHAQRDADLACGAGRM